MWKRKLIRRYHLIIFLNVFEEKIGGHNHGNSLLINYVCECFCIQKNYTLYIFRIRYTYVVNIAKKLRKVLG